MLYCFSWYIYFLDVELAIPTGYKYQNHIYPTCLFLSSSLSGMVPSGIPCSLAHACQSGMANSLSHSTIASWFKKSALPFSSNNVAVHCQYVSQDKPRELDVTYHREDVEQLRPMDKKVSNCVLVVLGRLIHTIT